LQCKLKLSATDANAFQSQPSQQHPEAVNDDHHRVAESDFHFAAHRCLLAAPLDIRGCFAFSAADDKNFMDSSSRSSESDDRCAKLGTIRSGLRDIFFWKSNAKNYSVNSERTSGAKQHGERWVEATRFESGQM
jgi:hypothetical protein